MEFHQYVWRIYTNTTKKISIPCNSCMDNTWCPRVNPFLRYVIIMSNLIVFNFMKSIYYAYMFFEIIHSFYIIIIDIDIPYLYIAGLQTKITFVCPVCGPKIKSCRSKRLSKEMFDEYRHFLSKNHRYWTIKEKNIQWEARDYIKTTENGTSPMEVAI